jgi:hypothetical protein
MLKINENCNELKAKFKQKYNHISNEDLQYNYGNKNIMLEKLQQKLGITGEDLQDIILDLS